MPRFAFGDAQALFVGLRYGQSRFGLKRIQACALRDGRTILAWPPKLVQVAPWPRLGRAGYILWEARMA